METFWLIYAGVTVVALALCGVFFRHDHEVDRVATAVLVCFMPIVHLGAIVWLAAAIYYHHESPEV